MAIERIDSVISSFIKKTETDSSDIFKLQALWKNMVGPVLAKHTQPATLYKKKLTIHVTENAAGFALRYEHPNLLTEIKNKLGVEITDIVIRAGSIQSDDAQG